MILTTLNEYLINEGASDILYHFTHSNHVKNILNTNKINLTVSIGSPSDWELNKGKVFFLSTTRSKSSGYVKGDTKIVLDGRTLKQNYKIIPVDYWQSKRFPSEQEDRIVSNKSFISNANKYILEIHIWLDNNNSNVREIINYCNKKDIPIFIYNTKKDFLYQRNPLKIKDIKLDKSENEHSPTQNDFDYETASFVAYNSETAYNKIIEYLKEEEKIRRFKDVLEEKTRKYYKKEASYNQQAILYIQNNIHNKRASANPGDRFLFDLLTKELKNHGTYSLKEYLNIKQSKHIDGKENKQKKLYEFISNHLHNKLIDEIEYMFTGWIEVDGKYYNYVYESDEVLALFYSKLNEISKQIKRIIFDDDLLNNTLKIYDIQDIDPSITITDKVNITGIDKNIKEIDEISNDIIKKVIKTAYSKAELKLNEINNI